MAQTAEYYRDQIMTQLAADSFWGPMLTSPSVFDLMQRIAYASGFVANTIDLLQDSLRAAVDADLQALFPHQIVWYRTQALLFMYGYTLPVDAGDYAERPSLTQDEINAASVVKFCAVSEDPDGRLTMKVAGLDGDNNRVPITSDQLTAFEDYMKRKKDAGVSITTVNETGDLLNIAYTIYYDPEVMNADGSLILGGTFPVNDAINAYLNNLPFNGELRLQSLDDAVQNATGVEIMNRTTCEVKPVTDIVYTPIDLRYVPYAGYFNINTLTVTYLPEP